MEEGVLVPGCEEQKQKSATKGPLKARIWTKIGPTPTIFRAGSDFAGPGAQNQPENPEKTQKLNPAARGVKKTTKNKTNKKKDKKNKKKNKKENMRILRDYTFGE